MKILGLAVALATLTLAGCSADESPFKVEEVEKPVVEEVIEGTCGEGSCGEEKTAEGTCGEEATAEGSCGSDKKDKKDKK